MLPAASVAKLAWVLAALRAHTAGRLDLLAPIEVAQVGETRHRDGLAVLAGAVTLPWVHVLGLALVTSANPAFDQLARVPGLADEAYRLGVAVTLTSGFSDADLDGPVRANLVSARAAAELLAAVCREADGPLLPLLTGLTNGARTTRLVRAVDSRPGLPESFRAPNKTGTLTGVRNDVALFTDGASALVVAALTEGQIDGPAVDGELADLGESLVAARWRS